MSTMNNDYENLAQELKLLSGTEFTINSIVIKPLTLREIVQIGYFNYLRSLEFFVLELDDLVENVPANVDISVFELLLCSGIEDLTKSFIKALTVFLRTKNIKINDEQRLATLDNTKILSKHNWQDICKIIQLQNVIKRNKKSEDDYHPANEKAKKLIEKIKKIKKEVPTPKEKVNLVSIISGLAWKAPNINILNIWDLTIYQLYNALTRLELIDTYQHTLNGIYAGTIEAKKIDLQKIHWAKIIK